MSLAVRAEGEELMDAVDLPADDYAAVLTDLGQVNRLTRAVPPTLDFVARAIGDRKSFRLLDVGFGDGGMLRAIADWAARAGRSAHLTGIDLNPNSTPVACAATPPTMRINYRAGDYAALAGRQFDLIVSSLVAHHMWTDELVAFLRFMEAEARLGWMVNDLHRHRVAHLGFPVLAFAMRWHPIVRHDGRLSIARSFRRSDWRDLLDAAGIPPGAAKIVRRFPFRLCVERLCVEPR